MRETLLVAAGVAAMFLAARYLSRGTKAGDMVYAFIRKLFS